MVLRKTQAGSICYTLKNSPVRHIHIYIYNIMMHQYTRYYQIFEQIDQTYNKGQLIRDQEYCCASSVRETIDISKDPTPSGYTEYPSDIANRTKKYSINYNLHLYFKFVVASQGALLDCRTNLMCSTPPKVFRKHNEHLVYLKLFSIVNLR